VFDTGSMVVPAELRQLADRARPVTLAREQTLPVAEALRPLLTDGALARGSAVALRGAGATTLALNLAAGPSTAGSWVVVVGLAELGLAAAAEAGIDLRRLALVDAPEPGRWAAVVAALVGGIDLIVVDGRAPLTATDGRRLASRLRERGSVLVPVTPGSLPAVRRPGAWPTDLTLTVQAGRWEGLGDGHGHLRRRRVQVEAEGRGRSARARRAELWLPSATGPVAPLSAAPLPTTGGSYGGPGGTPAEPARGGEGSTVVAFPDGGRRAG
jgi:hypothetical protein